MKKKHTPIQETTVRKGRQHLRKIAVKGGFFLLRKKSRRSPEKRAVEKEKISATDAVGKKLSASIKEKRGASFRPHAQRREKTKKKKKKNSY